MLSPMIFVAVALALSSSSFKMALAQCGCYPVGVSGAVCNGRSLTSIPSCVPINITALSIQTPSIPLVANTIRRFPKLRHLHIGKFTNLRVSKTFLSGQPLTNKLEIQNSDLAYIDNQWFQYARAIKILNFNYNNKLSSMSADTFRWLTQLTELSLVANQFTTLPPTLLQGTSIRTLWLRQNPWHCDCELANFMQSVRSRRVTVRDQALCVYPEELRGLDLRSLTTTVACK